MKTFRSTIDFACVAIPKVFGGIFLVVLNVSLMSWLGTDGFGVYALCVAALSLLSEGLFGAAIDLSVLRLAPLHLAADAGRALRIEREALRLKLQVVGSISLVMTLASVPVSQFLFHRSGDWYLIVITCAAALGSLCLSSALLHFQIRGHFLRYGILDSVQILVKFGGIAAILYYLHANQRSLDPSYLLLCFLAAPIVACSLFFFTNRNSVRTESAANLEDSRKELLTFAKWYLFTLMVTSIIGRADIFAVTLFCNIDEVGVFSAGHTIAMIPLMLGFYLSIIFSPRVMPVCRAGKFFGLLCAVQLPLFLVSLVGYAIFFWCQEFVTEDLLPETYAASSQVILILLPAALVGMMSYPLAVSFLMFIRPRFIVTVDLALLPLQLISYAIFVPRDGAVGAATVTAMFGFIRSGIAQVAVFYWARKTPQQLGIVEA